MPQYFLSGWIDAYPGNGDIVLNLPPGTVDATIEVTPQDGVPDGAITVYGTTIETQVTTGPDTVETIVTVQIGWTNDTDQGIPVDYAVTPIRA